MPIDAAVRQEMLGYDTCLISDAMERLGLKGGSAELSRRTTRQRVFGPAVTVRLELFAGEPSKHHLGTSAIEASEPGSVIVVQHRSRADCAGWGGLLSTAAKRKGLSGVVVDGLVRDIDESESLEFPVFSRGVTPVTARGRVVEVATNTRISCGGLVVDPGDFVMADGSGIVVIPQARLDDVMAAARDMQAFEAVILQKLDQGLSIMSAMDRSYEEALNAKKGLGA